MPRVQQGGNTMARPQPAEHVEKCQHTDDAGDASKPVDDAIAEHRHDDDERAEDHDAERIIDMQQLADRLPGQYATAGGKTDVHKAYRDDWNDRAVNAELHAAGNHL